MFFSLPSRGYRLQSPTYLRGQWTVRASRGPGTTMDTMQSPLPSSSQNLDLKERYSFRGHSTGGGESLGISPVKRQAPACSKAFLLSPRLAIPRSLF